MVLLPCLIPCLRCENSQPSPFLIMQRDNIHARTIGLPKLLYLIPKLYLKYWNNIWFLWHYYKNSPPISKSWIRPWESRQDSWTKSTRNCTNEHEWQFERFVILWKVNWSTWHERGTKKKTSWTPVGRSIHWARRTRGKQRHLSEFICDRRLAYCKDQHCQWPCSLWVLVAQWIERPPGVQQVMRWIPVGGTPAAC